MSTIDIVYLSAVICAFAVFAVGLAWGQYYTRNVDGRGSGGLIQVKPGGGSPAPRRPAAVSSATSRSVEKVS